MSAPPTIRQLRCALAAFDTGSLSAAAQHLGRGAATVSVHISTLEASLAFRLFTRTVEGLVPTAAGRQLERIARPLVADLAATLSRLRAGMMHEPEAIVLGLRLAPPGSPAREAVARAAARGATEIPSHHLRMLPLAAMAPPAEAGLTLDAADGSPGLIDRWVLAGPMAGAQSIALPELPAILARAANARAAALALPVIALNVPPERLDELPRPWRHPILLPSLLLPGWLRGGRTELTLLPPGADDPIWDIKPLGRAASGQAVQRAVTRLTDELLQRTGKPALRRAAAEPWPEAIEREHLDCFEAAWRHASLTRAARELGITQPAATLRLQQLEAALGRKLFERHPHGLSPTAAAERLAGPAAAFVQDIRRLGSSLAALAGPRGQVRAGCVPALDEASLLAEAIARSTADWNLRFPDRQLHLIEALSTELRRLVLTSIVDLAFVDNDAPQPGLVVRPITREPIVAVTASGSGLLHAGPVRLAALATLRLALPTRYHGLRWIVDRSAAGAGIEIVPSAEIDSLAATMRLVKSGEWATLLPLGAVRGAVDVGALQVNTVVDPTLERQISVVKRHGEAVSDEALALVDLFSAHMRQAL